jgi:hypothetical protein
MGKRGQRRGWREKNFLSRKGWIQYSLHLTCSLAANHDNLSSTYFHWYSYRVTYSRDFDRIKMSSSPSLPVW